MEKEFFEAGANMEFLRGLNLEDLDEASANKLIQLTMDLWAFAIGGPLTHEFNEQISKLREEVESE